MIIMNANATGVLAKTITSATKFNGLTLVENGLVLKYGKKQLRQISFSGIDKIYIKVYNLKPIYAFLFVWFPMLFAFLCFEYIKLNIEMSVALLPIIPAIVKINRFKRYDLIIILKDSSVFKKKVPLKLKSDTVDLINEVKRKCLHFNLYGWQHYKVNTVSVDCNNAAIDYISDKLKRYSLEALAVINKNKLQKPELFK